MVFIEPDPTAVEQFLQDFPADTPVVMLNLLKFNEQANYATHAEVEPCSGMDAFLRYGAEVAPMIF